MPEALITIAAYPTAYEAHLVRSQLAAFGIEARLADEHLVNANWLWSNAVGGVKVQVPESQVTEAEDILQSPPIADEDEPDALCPHCGGSDVHPFLEKRLTFLTWLILGLPLLPPTGKLVCHGCGQKWSAYNPS